MKRFVFAGVVFVCVLVNAAFGAGTYDGGDGTAETPYRIATAGQLHDLSLHSEDWDKCFVLTADIDMDPNIAGNITYSDSLIGVFVDSYTFYDDDFPFTGTFDGNRHSIKNLFIDAGNEDYIGLFGFIEDGVVKNLGLENVIIKGSRNVGGLVAYNKGAISQCFVEGDVYGNSKVGGFAGRNTGTIRECFNTGKVIVESSGGGFVGINYGPFDGLADSYSTASVTCVNSPSGTLAGFVAEGGGTHRCYSTGAVTWDDMSDTSYKGGFAPEYDSAPYVSCFWDIDSSGMTFGGDSVTGLSTRSMKKMRFFSFAGWDGGVWTIDEGNDYPRLAWEGSAGVPIAAYSLDFNGSGTEEAPYQIASADDLRILGLNLLLWNKNFVLTADIDLAGLYFTPIGNRVNPDGEGRPFSGKFDGGEHVIRNLTIVNAGVYSGFFGALDFGAEVKSLGLENINVSGYDKLGGLAGVNRGTISQCYVTGEVNCSGSYNIICGGFIGVNVGSVRYCYGRVNVTGSGLGIIGGFTGQSFESEILKCYCVGQIDAGGIVGGFLGDISPYDNWSTSCFWDSTVNPELSDHGYAQGMDTVSMQKPVIYAFNGWSGDIWTINAGNDYPRLAWEGADGVAISDNGDGSVGNPYRLSTAFDLLEVDRRNNSYGGVHFLLTNDIDMDPNVTGLPVFHEAPIGGGRYGKFSGIFDGGGHVISNLVVEYKEGVSSGVDSGLFGIVGRENIDGAPGIVKNLGVENVQIIGNDSAGGLVGYLIWGEVSQCYSTGTVSNHEPTLSGRPGSSGGLVGRNYSGIVKDCYSMCDVSTANGGYVGGVVGRTFLISDSDVLEVRNCYFGGHVSGDIAGGVIGRDNQGSYPNCFWDSSVNPGLSDCGYDIIAEIYDVDLDAVEGMTTGDMQSKLAFTDAGWDFVGESVNGDADVWQMLVDGSWYPRLAWEFSAGDFVGADGVDMSDLAYFAGRYGAASDIEHADLDGDGVVGVLDLCIFASHWLE